MGGIGNFFSGLGNDIVGGVKDIGQGVGDIFKGDFGGALQNFGGAAMNAAPFLGMAGLGPIGGMVGLGGALAGGQKANMANGQYGSFPGMGGMGGGFSPYLPLMAGLMGNQFGAPFGIKMYPGGPYADQGAGDKALNYANILGNAGINQLQQGMNGLPGLGQMGSLAGMPNIMNMEAQLSGLPLNFSGLMNPQGSPYQLNTQAPGTMTPTAGTANRGVNPGAMAGGSPPIAGQTPPWANTGNWSNDVMNNRNFAAYNQGLQPQGGSVASGGGTGATRDVPTTGGTSPASSPVTQTGALNPNQLPQFMQEQYNRVADDAAQGFQASMAGLQQQFAANGITDPRAIAAAEAQLSAGHSKLLADTHASLMGQNMQNQQNQLNQFGNQLGSLYGAQYGQQQEELGNAQRMMGAGMGAYQNAQDVALRQSAINALMQSGLWGNLMGYGGGMPGVGMNMGQQGMNMGGTQFNPQTGQYEYPDGTPAFYGPGAPGDLPITDPNSGIMVDPTSGMYFDPTSGTMIDSSMWSQFDPGFSSLL